MKIAAETIHTHRDCLCLVSSSNIYKLSKTARAPLIVKAEVLHVRVRDVDVCIFEIKVMSIFYQRHFQKNVSEAQTWQMGIEPATLILISGETLQSLIYQDSDGREKTDVYWFVRATDILLIQLSRYVHVYFFNRFRFPSGARLLWHIFLGLL